MLSQNVSASLEEAQGHLRNALFHAAKNEKASVNKQISEIMLAIEYLMKMEEMSDKIESFMNKMNNREDNNPFYGGMF